MLNVYHSPVHLFSSFHFSGCTSFGNCLSYSRVQFPYSSIFLIWLLLQMPLLLTGLSIFWVLSWFPLSISGASDQAVCAGFILPYRELQAIALMMHRMAFQLSGKVVALHLHNSTAKAYLCHQSGKV